MAETGGAPLDEEGEISSAVASILEQVDDNNDQVVKIEDLAKHWANIGTLLSADEVVNWLLHALQLPYEIVSQFSAQGVSGYDFPDLLANQGALLETQLNITNPVIRSKILQGIRVKVLLEVLSSFFLLPFFLTIMYVVNGHGSCARYAAPDHRQILQLQPDCARLAS